MPSPLETIPLDVLTTIVFFSVASDTLRPPDSIFQLQLCSRTIHDSLTPRACPQLYARTFRAKFDLVSSSRRCYAPWMPSSFLAAELQQRCRVLRRVRHCQLERGSIIADLWTIYLMILESDGLNEMQLQAAGISAFMRHLFRQLREGWAAYSLSSDRPVTIISLAMSIACLTWSREFILDLPVEERNELLSFFRPFAVAASKCSSIDAYGIETYGIQTTPDGLDDRSDTVIDASLKNRLTTHSDYYRAFAVTCPSLLLMSGSIFLTFALKEVSALQVPPHLPLNRAAATTASRPGPTREDFFAIAERRTPLVADSFHQTQRPISVLRGAIGAKRPSRSAAHDEDFYRIARHLDLRDETQKLRSYIPGLLAGLWEGSYMVSPVNGCQGATDRTTFAESPDFVCRQPIQCRLQEHLCFSPYLPFPVSADGGFEEGVFPQGSSLGSPGEISENNEFSDGSSFGEYSYEPLRLHSAPESGEGSARQPLDVVITGETPQKYDAAWGAYNFAGRVRLSDGLIILTRKPKSAGDAGCGTWIFEGYMQSRRVLVGRWRSSGSRDQVGGIFSLSRTEE
ncbi:hypothetical protein BV22DRAFT_264697 [Leucogyrophana mollusca]|uniref:Uncharacterized protein n=1 Tax=Leucogyrophana mollusca TaxID=85980 RepID=A0ACB8BRT2_9AGAM|nr:hypothetical protein BV22DRAFT_264697 [Leucogyrophana mollusca]